ncbi:MAG: hypothetical protein LBG19_05350 [Prevotellaceae bacterium]|jgi:hypothetical protein|nr:hypothetical protein [Prevotellaceae bacterium]
MKKSLCSILYGAIILAATVSLVACGGSQSNKLIIDGKPHTISIKEITYTDGFCRIELQTDKEVVEKFQASNNAPFWLGTINDNEYTSASGRIVLKEGLIFIVEAPTKANRIVIFTPDQESVVEFDEATLKAVSNPSVEEITNLVHSIDPELCKKFDGYQPLSSSQNSAGISLEVVSAKTRISTFGMIKYENVEIKSRQNYTNEFTSHFYAVDADDRTKSLDIHLRGGRSIDNTEFFGVVMFDGNVDAKYALIIFEGTDSSVSPDLVTPSFFYVVELGDKYTEGENTYTAIKSCCTTPYLTGDIFKNKLKE